MKLKPRKFEKLQPHEFFKLIEGYNWRREHKEDLFAYFTSQLMNLEGKCLTKPIGIKELVSPLRGHKQIDPKKAEAEYLKERFKNMLNE